MLLRQGPLGAEGSDPRSFNDGKAVPNQTVIYPTEGVFEVCSPVAIIKNAKNPNAAKLFAQWMVSEVSLLGIWKTHATSRHLKVDRLLGDVVGTG